MPSTNFQYKEYISSVAISQHQREIWCLLWIVRCCCRYQTIWIIVWEDRVQTRLYAISDLHSCHMIRKWHGITRRIAGLFRGESTGHKSQKCWALVFTWLFTWKSFGKTLDLPWIETTSRSCVMAVPGLHQYMRSNLYGISNSWTFRLFQNIYFISFPLRAGLLRGKIIFALANKLDIGTDPVAEMNI